MLDLPGHPIIDKHALMSGCVRLPLGLDAGRLAAEVTALPDSTWGTRGGRIGVHSAAEAVFLRGYAPAEGDRPIVDRPILDLLPYAREIITDLIGEHPLRCLLARLPAGATVLLHIDQAPYFSKSLRIHVPVQTHDQAWMVCSGRGYLMRPGEVWALNNSAVHGVWNAHPSLPRTHLICDFLPSPRLLDLLARGRHDLGVAVPEVEAHLTSQPRVTAIHSG